MGSGRQVQGTGLGLRHPFMEQFAAETPPGVDFVEITAEHYIGSSNDNLRSRCMAAVLEQVPAVCHALNSNFGGAKAFDEDWMHNLMPIPLTNEAVQHTAARIRRTSDILERPVALENISYLVTLGNEMTEAEFYAAVLEEADCLALLDVNNLYLNSQNNGYDAEAFLDAIPPGRIAYAHMAGHIEQVVSHEDEEDEVVMLMDSHGHALADPVLDLLDAAYVRHGVFPAIVERDQNIPPVPELLAELDAIREIQKRRQPLAAASA